MRITIVLISFILVNISFGQVLFDWEKSICGGADILTSKSSGIFDQFGNSYYSGTFSNTIDFDPGVGTYNMTATGSNSGYISKFDIDGNFIWAMQLESVSGYTSITDIDINDSNEIILTGKFIGTADFDPTASLYPISSSGIHHNVFIIKLDMNANLIWAHSWTSNNSYFKLTNIHISNNSSIYLTGQASGTIDLDPSSSIFNATFPIQSTFILKLNSNGSFDWYKAIQPNASGYHQIYLNDISSDSSGNCYFVGVIRELTIFDPANTAFQFVPHIAAMGGSGSFDAIFFKLSDQGNLLWANIFADSSSSYFMDIVLDQEMNLLISGHFTGNLDINAGIGVHTLASKVFPFLGTQASDFLITKYSNNGSFIWGHSFGKETNDGGILSIATDSNSNCFLTSQDESGGNSFLDFDPGPDTVESISYAFGSRVFIMKLDSAGLFKWVRSTHTDVFPTNMVVTSIYPKNISVFQNKILTSGVFAGAIDFDIHYGNLSIDSCNMDASYIWQIKECDIPITTDSIVSCGQHTWVNGVTYTSSNSSSVYTFQTLEGCDSTVQLNLTILSPSIISDSIESCVPYQWINGITYSNDNSTAVYTIPGGAINGCDSIIQLHLKIFDIDTTVNIDELTLSSVQIGIQYQWLDCNNNYSEIIGEVGQSFTTVTNGSFAIQITNDICIDTSSCHLINSVGLRQLNNNYLIDVFPNPTLGNVYVELDKKYTVITIEIYNTAGQLVNYLVINDNEHTFLEINISKEPGIYFLKLNLDGNSINAIKIIKE